MSFFRRKIYICSLLTIVACFIFLLLPALSAQAMELQKTQENGVPSIAIDTSGDLVKSSNVRSFLTPSAQDTLNKQAQFCVIASATKSSLLTASAIGLAGALDAQILFIDSNELNEQIELDIKDTGAPNVVLIGRNDIISSSVEQKIKDIPVVSNVYRIDGKTSSEVANNIYSNFIGDTLHAAWSKTCYLALEEQPGINEDIASIIYRDKSPVFLIDANKSLDFSVLKNIYEGAFSKVVVIDSADEIPENIKLALYGLDLTHLDNKQAQFAMSNDNKDETYIVNSEPRSGQWLGLITEPSQDVIKEILTKYSASSQEEVESVSRQISDCAQSGNSIVIVNPFELNPYSKGSTAYNINIAALSNNAIPANSDISLKYLYAGDQTQSSKGDIFSAGQVEKVKSTYQKMVADKDGNVDFNLFGGGIYAIGDPSSIDDMVIDPIEDNEEISDIPNNSSNSSDIVDGYNTTSQPAGSLPMSASGIPVQAGSSPMGSVGGVEVSRALDGVSLDFLKNNENGLLVSAGADLEDDQFSSDDANIPEQMFMDEGSIDTAKLTLLVLMLLLSVVSIGSILYFFIKNNSAKNSISVTDSEDIGSDASTKVDGMPEKKRNTSLIVDEDMTQEKQEDLAQMGKQSQRNVKRTTVL